MNDAVFSPGSCWKCDQCAINHRSICRGASEEALRELGRLSHLRRFEKGQVIIAQGDEADLVGNVISGIVKLTNMSMGGHQNIVGLLFPSDFFGRAYADLARFSYEAATDVTLCCMSRHAFENFLGRHPDMEHEILLSTLDELDATREWAAMNSSHTTMQRVATFFFILSRRSDHVFCDAQKRHRMTNPVIALPIGRRDIAAYLGTTPETLSRNIQTLVRKHVIRPIDTNHFELTDTKGLIEHSGETREDLVSMSRADRPNEGFTDQA
ncbi:Crp/Fnr family transcriptional regulator [Oricola sp.]|uniref:Crp/Fnr family transcriptional regulator n=1 Tax=Oricola sp. TaxID=1979950 RepID=UPI00267BEFAD